MKTHIHFCQSVNQPIALWSLGQSGGWSASPDSRELSSETSALWQTLGLLLWSSAGLSHPGSTWKTERSWSYIYRSQSSSIKHAWGPVSQPTSLLAADTGSLGQSSYRDPGPISSLPELSFHPADLALSQQLILLSGLGSDLWQLLHSGIWDSTCIIFS